MYKRQLLERQLKPEARRDIIQKLAEEGIQPVSYTHLDVYKRQKEKRMKSPTIL